eukprot:1184637-Prorocentrum_minimum.AAC.2
MQALIRVGGSAAGGAEAPEHREGHARWLARASTALLVQCARQGAGGTTQSLQRRQQSIVDGAQSAGYRIGKAQSTESDQQGSRSSAFGTAQSANRVW